MLCWNLSESLRKRAAEVTDRIHSLEDNDGDSEEDDEGSEGDEFEGGHGEAKEGDAAFESANIGEELNFVSKISIVRPRCFDYTGFR